MWDLEAGIEKSRLFGHNGWVESISTLLQKFLVSSSCDGIRKVADSNLKLDSPVIVETHCVTAEAILYCRLWSMDDFSCVSVLQGEANDQRAAMESCWGTAAAITAQPLKLAKTSDGKGQVVEIVVDRGETLVSIKTIFITPPYFSSKHVFVTALSLSLFTTSHSFLHYKLNLS